jgi:hypothetical protein
VLVAFANVVFGLGSIGALAIIVFSPVRFLEAIAILLGSLIPSALVRLAVDACSTLRAIRGELSRMNGMVNSAGSADRHPGPGP